MNRLKGKNIIVTGAARGMGQSIADDLLQEGGNVLYADLDAGVVDVAASAGSRIDGSAAGRAVGMKADISKREDVKALVEKCVSQFGSLDIMFNNAGVNKPLNFLDVTDENWDFIMKVNAYGVLIGTQEAARQMIAQGKGGKIINTASIAGRQGYDNIAPYCASKFAVISLTQSAARAFAKNDITVNGFAPGVVNTPLWEKLDLDLMEIGASEKPGQAIAAFSAGILRGRAATAKDIVGTTTYLASADSDYMTGQIIMIDGGMVLL